jgi:hypothetical protein
MKEYPMDLDTLMRETAPVADPTRHALASGGAALDAAIRRTARELHGMGRNRGRRTRRFAVGAVVAAAASAALLLGPAFNLLGSRQGASADAAQVLVRAGAAAGAQPGGWPHAKYWYSVSKYRQGSGATYRRQVWIGNHDIGVLEDPGVSSGVIPIGVARFPAGSRGLTWDQLYALPTDAQALERQLRAGIDGAGPDDNSELFTIVGDLLRESPAPPALRKALWDVAAHIPGVTLVGAVTDAAGRRGIAVERSGQRYVLDPNNGRLLDESETGGWSASYLEQRPVDTAPAPNAQ